MEEYMPKALITGINGQDGSFLAELLLENGYEVHGTMRRASIENESKNKNILPIRDRLVVHPMQLDNQLSIYKLIQKVRPDECYHLAASSFVSYSFDDEEAIIKTNFNTTHYLLSCLKELVPQCRFYFAGSSEMFGNATCFPQDESTPFNPRSIYGISKLSSYHVVKNYRDFHGMYACTGITFNHESERRSNIFVTKKVSTHAAKAYFNPKTVLELGNLDAQRDWGYAPEYVEAMFRMLRNPLGPKDYVLATGKLHSVKDLLKVAFEEVGLDYEKHIKVNAAFFRPGEQIPLVGNADEIHNDLNWAPRVSFEQMIRKMVRFDMAEMKDSRTY